VLAFHGQHAFALDTVIALAESRPDLGLRWPSRLVATAAEDRLSVKRNPHTSFAEVSDLPDVAERFENVCSAVLTEKNLPVGGACWTERALTRSLYRRRPASAHGTALAKVFPWFCAEQSCADPRGGRGGTTSGTCPVRVWTSIPSAPVVVLPRGTYGLAAPTAPLSEKRCRSTDRERRAASKPAARSSRAVEAVARETYSPLGKRTRSRSLAGGHDG
jgi:hypothetical protein